MTFIVFKVFDHYQKIKFIWNAIIILGLTNVDLMKRRLTDKVPPKSNLTSNFQGHFLSIIAKV